MKNLDLQAIVEVMNTMESTEGIGITLSAKGVLITGLMISKHDFYKAEENHILNRTSLKLREIQEKENLTNEDTHPLSVYLKEAFYLHGTQNIPTSNGVYMVVDMDSIDSFVMGRMNISDN